MKVSDVFSLVFLAAIWGASFLFMRVSAPEFGAVALIALRVAIAGLFLLPFFFKQAKPEQVAQHWKALSVVGVLNSALPFTLLAYATLSLSAGYTSILNAATPIFAAFIGSLWFASRFSKSALLGLLLGFLGVILLVWEKLAIGQLNTSLAVAAGLSGALCYAFAANYSKKHLIGVSPLAITTGSQFAATLFLIPFAIIWWPDKMPSQGAWINVIILAVVCTGMAQVIYFKLIDNVGPANATTVTFLIPIFGVLWGYWFLDEVLSLQALFAGLVILVGVTLATGFYETLIKRLRFNR
ncbi:DMT family transporter [Aliikangiella sp. IMCC44632]